MRQEDDEIHVDSKEASAGESDGRGHVRWILAVGTVLAIAALSVIWMTGALTQGEVEEEATASGRIASQEDGETTDSLVGNELDELDATAPATEAEIELAENEDASQ